MNSIKNLRQKLERLRGRQVQIENEIEIVSQKLTDERRALHRHEQAREIIREVGLKTQQELEYHISDITSLALNSVFDDPYELKTQFIERRNKTECDLLFERNGEVFDPVTASGGGAVDVAAFALRIASWVIATPRSRSVMILDEPMRFLSQKYQESASQMMKELSDRLGIQFIIVTHEQTLTLAADKVFEVSIKKGISKVATV